jgi:hypothetical protein
MECSRLVVAPWGAAEVIEDGGVKDSSWPCAALHECSVFDLALLHCVAVGVDPAAPLTPTELRVNPFTTQSTAMTAFDRYMAGFRAVFRGELADVEALAADGVLVGQPVLFRVPPELVSLLATLDAENRTDLARRWLAAKSSQECASDGSLPSLSVGFAVQLLDSVIAMAKVAEERNEVLFLLDPMEA